MLYFRCHLFHLYFLCAISKAFLKLSQKKFAFVFQWLAFPTKIQWQIGNACPSDFTILIFILCVLGVFKPGKKILIIVFILPLSTWMKCAIKLFTSSEFFDYKSLWKTVSYILYKLMFKSNCRFFCPIQGSKYTLDHRLCGQWFQHRAITLVTVQVHGSISQRVSPNLRLC